MLFYFYPVFLHLIKKPFLSLAMKLDQHTSDAAPADGFYTHQDLLHAGRIRF